MGWWFGLGWDDFGYSTPRFPLRPILLGLMRDRQNGSKQLDKMSGISKIKSTQSQNPTIPETCWLTLYVDHLDHPSDIAKSAIVLTFLTKPPNPARSISSKFFLATPKAIPLQSLKSCTLNWVSVWIGFSCMYFYANLSASRAPSKYVYTPLSHLSGSRPLLF